jgi:C4-dicarboxylate-specific signal transduction histidine kinase
LLAKNEELTGMTQQLWQAAKLATMGELAASVAHELNNPLAIISLRIESLLAQLAEDDPSQTALQVVEAEVERMGELVQNCCTLAGAASPRFRRWTCARKWAMRSSLCNTICVIAALRSCRSFPLTRL